MFFSFRADAGTAASCTPDFFRNGLLGSYVEGLEAGRPPAAVQRDALIYANDVLPAPFEITWKGALAAPRRGAIASASWPTTARFCSSTPPSSSTTAGSTPRRAERGRPS